VGGAARWRRDADGERLGGVRPKERLGIRPFEATRTDLVARHAPAVTALAPRVRIDAVCSLKEHGARSVDIAAAQLIVRELGYSIALFDDPRAFADAELDLVVRSRVAAAATDELCARLAAALVS
jgi:hypothetical protein